MNLIDLLEFFFDMGGIAKEDNKTLEEFKQMFKNQLKDHGSLGQKEHYAGILNLLDNTANTYYKQDNALQKVSDRILGHEKLFVIAVDFDSTLADTSWETDANRITASPTELAYLLQQLKESFTEVRLILNTCRGDELISDVQAHKHLAAATTWLQKYDLDYDRINASYLYEGQPPETQRKVFADVYIDDKANLDKATIWVRSCLADGILHPFN
jgi:hypothetical protein